MASTGEPFGLFWNSNSGDRTYDASSFEHWLKKFFTTGVFTDDLQVLASSGMDITVGTGYANVDGKVKFWDDVTTLTLEAAHSTYPRIDTVVITRDNVNRSIDVEIVTGSYSGDTPRPTAPVRNVEKYQIVLAQIYVKNGVTAITQGVITDTRPDSSLCGYITGTVTEMDFSQFSAQFSSYLEEFEQTSEADYDAWFSALMTQAQIDKADWDAWYAELQEELHDLPEDTAEYLQIEIDEIKQSGTSGSIINVSTLDASFEGGTVTVTNGTETATGTFDEFLRCSIKGFKGVGRVTVTGTNGVDTYTSHISVPYFGNYNVTLAAWAATVNLQGDENLYGETITVKNSNDETVDTITLSLVDGTGVFTAVEADTYTFNYSYDGMDFSESLAVTAATTYSLELTTGFSWKEWVDASRTLDPTDYDDLSEVLADEKALRQLFLVHDCVDYIAGLERVNSDLETVLNDDYCAKWRNLSDYALDKFYANTAIKAAMDEADKYGYGEWVITDDTTTPPTWGPKGNVPKMTSNTAPYGTASAYQVFDGNASTTASGTNISYKFTNPICPKDFYCNVSGGTLQASNDGSTWDTPTSGSYYLYLRLHFESSVSPHIIQFYGRELKVSVPIMTSDTAPYGEAFASAIYSASYDAWKAFDSDFVSQSSSWRAGSGKSSNQYVGYTFGYDVVVKAISIAPRQSGDTPQTALKNFKIQGSSNNFASIEDVYVGQISNSSGGTATIRNFSFTNDAPYKAYRLYCIDNYGNVDIGVSGLQFYGLDYSEKEFEVGATKKWLYDHGVELETLSLDKGPNGGIVPIKNDSSITFESGSSSSSWSRMAVLIDLSNYNFIRAKIGSFITVGNNSVYILVENTSQSSELATRYINNANCLPNNEYLNISSINQQANAEFSCASAKSAKAELVEFWLE